MLKKFLHDTSGNYAIATAVLVVPLLGALALAVDYTEISRQRAMTLNALDAAGIAAARHFLEGNSESATLAYAKDFFKANMSGLDTSGVQFQIDFPSSETGGGEIVVNASLAYKPYFYGAFADLLGAEGPALNFASESRIRLKNTLEVALVLDNSGSMDYKGSGSGKKRIDLLKAAAKELVSTLAGQAAQIKQVNEPVRFSLVPFAASVNVGPQYVTASWMDIEGRSPIHHENFDWTTMPSSKRIQLSGGIYYKTGSGWGAEEGQKVTRFTLFNELKRVTGRDRVSKWEQECRWTWSGYRCEWVDNGDYQYTYGSFAGWQGCVEVRPYPYNLDDTPPSSSTPATLYVPMFAPDETDQYSGGYASNNWWNDITGSGSHSSRQKYMPKYFEPAGQGTSVSGSGEGPNSSCTTKPITPLTDVTTSAGKKKIEDAIDAMAPLGATNVPEGIAWGWKTVSHSEPFTEGRAEFEKGNDKVLIILTDGANTYYTPGSLGYADAAGNKSTYSAYGYTGKDQPGENRTRMFMGTSVSKSDFSNSNYTDAMTQQMNAMCEKAKTEGLLLMTVSLDLSTSNSDEKGQIEALKSCASDSRFKKDGSGKAMKLFWNTTGGDLEQTFKSIADELSNLRIVG